MIRCCFFLLILMLPTQVLATRFKEALEKHELGTLQYRAFSTAGGVNLAYVMDKSKYLHLIRVGSYVGRNHGKVKEITEKGILIEELFQAESGEWEERDVFMEIQGSDPN